MYYAQFIHDDLQTEVRLNLSEVCSIVLLRNIDRFPSVSASHIPPCMAGCYISLTACPTWLGEQPLTGVFALGAPSEVGGGEGQTSSNPRFIGGPQSLFAGTNQFSPGKGSHLTHTHSLITLFRLCFLL